VPPICRNNPRGGIALGLLRAEDSARPPPPSSPAGAAAPAAGCCAIGLGLGYAAKDLHGKELVFFGEERRVPRFLYFHLVMALVRIGRQMDGRIREPDATSNALLRHKGDVCDRAC